MDSDDKNIDAAKMQRQVFCHVIAANKEHHHFEQLIGNQQNCYHFTPAGLAGSLHFPVPKAIGNRDPNKYAEPDQMQSAKGWKAHTINDRLNRIYKILHILYLQQNSGIRRHGSALYGNYNSCGAKPQGKLY